MKPDVEVAHCQSMSLLQLTFVICFLEGFSNTNAFGLQPGLVWGSARLGAGVRFGAGGP